MRGDGRSQSLLIAQITDLHIGFEPGNPDEFNRRRLDAVFAELATVQPRPDFIVASGDLTENGDLVDYLTLKAIFDASPVPVLPMMGNHDLRETFWEVFPEVPGHDGFVEYVVDKGPLRILLLDTLEVGRHGGAFCDIRARWLDERLAETDKPVVVFLHHPPVQTGIDWMTINAAEPWAAKIEAVIARHGNVVAVLAGHIHRSINVAWAGTRISVCPSTAPQVALDLREIDPANPDGRPLIVSEPPAYALHLWNGQTLLSHLGLADGHAVLASYTPQLQPMVEGMLVEREAAVAVS
ncbi:phosphodiesterase [Sphingoaurantiacus capsulatus]|uniref:Phosphodiesterase n=1 Tax=Sphingoaurantiacus capsulatus TaxID=1771310 RepID=A0ABV7X8U0_9SPHN